MTTKVGVRVGRSGGGMGNCSTVHSGQYIVYRVPVAGD